MAATGEDIDITDTADHTDPSVGDDDDDESNTTQPFTPAAASTPYQPPGASAGPYHGGEAHELSQFSPERTGQDTDPLLAGDELDQRLQRTRQASAWADLTEMYHKRTKMPFRLTIKRTNKETPGC